VPGLPRPAQRERFGGGPGHGLGQGPARVPGSLEAELFVEGDVAITQGALLPLRFSIHVVRRVSMDGRRPSRRQPRVTAPGLVRQHDGPAREPTADELEAEHLRLERLRLGAARGGWRRTLIGHCIAFFGRRGLRRKC
jgi:hypothetical protein